MSRKFLIPAIVAASLTAGASVAQAGTVFDFIPRLDFAQQTVEVSKDSAPALFVCGDATGKAKACAVDVNSITPKSSQDAKK